MIRENKDANSNIMDNSMISHDAVFGTAAANKSNMETHQGQYHVEDDKHYVYF